MSEQETISPITFDVEARPAETKEFILYWANEWGVPPAEAVARLMDQIAAQAA